MWGLWNDDNWGYYHALTKYTDTGIEVDPKDALPGDFLSMSWKNGGGHAVIFLEWIRDKKGKIKEIKFWSSQKRTNGIGDALCKITDIYRLSFIRVTKPENIFAFDPDKKIEIIKNIGKPFISF